MSHTIELRSASTRALERMRALGFSEAQVTAVSSRQDEVNLALNEVGGATGRAGNGGTGTARREPVFKDSPKLSASQSIGIHRRMSMISSPIFHHRGRMKLRNPLPSQR